MTCFYNARQQGLKVSKHFRSICMHQGATFHVQSITMHVSAASLAPDWPVHKATPSDNTERTACSGTMVETIYLSRPQHAQYRACGMTTVCLDHMC